MCKMIKKESTFIELVSSESKFAFDLITNFIRETLSTLQRRKRAASACRKYRHISSLEIVARPI